MFITDDMARESGYTHLFSYYGIRVYGMYSQETCILQPKYYGTTNLFKIVNWLDSKLMDFLDREHDLYLKIVRIL